MVDVNACVSLVYQKTLETGQYQQAVCGYLCNGYGKDEFDLKAEAERYHASKHPERIQGMHVSIWEVTRLVSDAKREEAKIADFDSVIDKIKQLKRAQDELEAMTAEREKAIRALESAGYTLKEGAREWKPPLGKSASPLLDELESLRSENRLLKAELEKARKQDTFEEVGAIDVAGKQVSATYAFSSELPQGTHPLYIKKQSTLPSADQEEPWQAPALLIWGKNNITWNPCYKGPYEGEFYASPVPAQQAAVPDGGLEIAAKYVEKLAKSYAEDHGHQEPDTGSWVFPGNGLDYLNWCEETAEEIRSLKTSGNLVDELAGLIKQLAWSLRKAAPANKLVERALDYLNRKGLIGNVLRNDESMLLAAPTPPSAEPDYKAQCITEQDARDICNSYWEFCTGHVVAKDAQIRFRQWFENKNHANGSALIAKLNESHQARSKESE